MLWFDPARGVVGGHGATEYAACNLSRMALEPDGDIGLPAHAGIGDRVDSLVQLVRLVALQFLRGEFRAVHEDVELAPGIAAPIFDAQLLGAGGKDFQVP